MRKGCLKAVTQHYELFFQCYFWDAPLLFLFAHSLHLFALDMFVFHAANSAITAVLRSLS